MKRTYYIHPESESGKRRVSVKIMTGDRKKRKVFYGVAWFDKPGTWLANAWNLHYDGCDYSCNSLEDCKAKLTELDGFVYNAGKYERVEVEFVETTEN